MLTTPNPSERQPRTVATLPRRVSGPHTGSFRKTELTTNHYEVKLSAIERIIVFRVKFTPPIPFDNRDQRTKLLDQISPPLRKFISNPVICGFTIYSLKEPQTLEETFTAGNHSINIKKVKTLDLTSNQSLLLTFLNNGLRNNMVRLGYAEIGRSGKYFNTKQSARKELDNLYIYSGFKANFVHLQKGYFLRVDSAKKIVRSQTVLVFIDNFYKLHDGKDRDEKRALLKGELADKVVMTNYGKHQYYKIIDLSFKKAEQIMLDEKTDMLKYYKQRYGITVTKTAQPLLEVEGRRGKKEDEGKGPILLLPEFCLMTGIPENFDEQRRKKISQASIKNPPEKVVEIEALMKELKDTDQMKALTTLGLQVKTSLSKFQAKAMPVPRLLLGGKNQVDSGKQAFFNLFNKPIYHSKHQVDLLIVSNKGTDINQVVQTFQSTSRNLGVNLNIYRQEFRDRSVREIEKTITGFDQDINICLIVLPGSMKNDYKKLKKETLKKELATQVMTDATIRKKNLQSIATKVLLQIIAKRGNTLWVPETAKGIEGCMLLAFDTAKIQSGTILAATATINSTFSTLHARTKVFFNPEEKFAAMRDLTLGCISAYFDRNKNIPKELIIFLNSCTGDQVSIYQQLYFNQLIPKLKEAYQAQPSITAIMVNVKNSERFFVNENGYRNVPAGTLVNEGMVSENYDFFLVSQHSNRGSTVPNHYRVIHCDSKMEEGLLQELIFSQCFNYVNWTGSIKVPAVLQYAKKCARFMGDVMEKEEVPEMMRGKPYFV